jgi:anti-sigma-K factor RskA
VRLRPDPHSLTGVYAVDAVDGTERDRFERHLGHCPSCEQEVRGLQETTTQLALAVTRDPPPGLKAAVLTEAARTRQHVASSARHAAPARAPRTRLALGFAAVATAAAVVLAVVLGLQRSELDNARSQQRDIAQVLNAPGARLMTGRTSVGGTATVVVAGSLHKLIFTSTGLPALTNAQVYQLWLIGPAGAKSAGLLPAASQGKTAPVLASGLVPGDQVGVTVEPAGGTSQPTTTPIVELKVTS